MWFAGADLQLLGANYGVKGQVMQGGAPGRPDQGVWGLDLNTSGYLQIDWQVLPLFGFLLRGEVRDAIVEGIEVSYGVRVEEGEMSEEETALAEELYTSKYNRSEWNLQR